jgi:YbbR domain-containing protein
MARSRRRSNFRPGLMLLALAISIFIWGVAQGSTDIRSSFDIPVEIHGVEESLVVTDQSADEVNVGVMGSRAALNNLDSSRIKYEIDVSKVKPGLAEFEVELASIELPRRARFVSHSPSRIQIRLERRSRKEVSVVADIQGEPAEGFALAEVRVVPDRVWLAGAKSHVMRVAEVQTELIDVSNLSESQERQVRLIVGGGTVWAEEDKPVTVEIVVEPTRPPEVLDELSVSPADEVTQSLRDSGGNSRG